MQMDRVVDRRRSLQVHGGREQAALRVCVCLYVCAPAMAGVKGVGMLAVVCIPQGGLVY